MVGDHVYGESFVVRLASYHPRHFMGADMTCT